MFYVFFTTNNFSFFLLSCSVVIVLLMTFLSTTLAFGSFLFGAKVMNVFKEKWNIKIGKKAEEDGRWEGNETGNREKRY